MCSGNFDRLLSGGWRGAFEELAFVDRLLAHGGALAAASSGLVGLD